MTRGSTFQDGYKLLFETPPRTVVLASCVRRSHIVLRKAIMLCYQVEHLRMNLNACKMQVSQQRQD
jgi:hypothetical protein